MEQKQIKKCPVCNCVFEGKDSLYLDWIVTIESENGFVPLLRCTSCYSPFYVRRKDGAIEAYLGDGTQ